MTEQERQELEQLEKNDLIDMVDTLREEGKRNAQEFAQKRAEIMTNFLTGKKSAPLEPVESQNEYDAENDPALKRLKNKYKGR